MINEPVECTNSKRIVIITNNCRFKISPSGGMYKPGWSGSQIFMFPPKHLTHAEITALQQWENAEHTNQLISVLAPMFEIQYLQKDNFRTTRNMLVITL
jgi:hypothetical protein